MNSDGSGLTNLTPGSPLNDQFPNFSPDGSQITFSRDVMGLDSEVFVMNADGSNQGI